MDVINSSSLKRMNKPLIIGYLRVSTDKQVIESQKLAIYDYAKQHSLIISTFVEVTVSSVKSTERRKIDELLTNLREGDTLLISELSRLGRSTIELLSLVKEITDRGIKLIIIKQNLVLNKNDNSLSNKVILTIFSMLAEIERDLIVQRTKEGLIAARSKGKTLGKPKGTIQASVFDSQKEQIVGYLKKGLPVSSIAKLLNLKVGESRNLLNYVKRRKLRTN